MTAPMVLDGPMNGTAFLAYLEQVLVPTLRPGDIVVMDNLPAHKSEAVRRRVERAGAELRLLPPYSPDLNPIEMAFAKLKAILRKAAERRSTACGMPSPALFPSSPQTNAQTTSPPQDTPAYDWNLL